MTKRKKVIIIAAVCAVSLLLVSALAVRILFFEPYVPSRRDDFLPLVNEYTQVAEFYSSDFEKYDADRLTYYETYCFTENYKHYLSPDEQELDALMKVEDSYYLDKHPLEFVEVSGDFVYLCCGTGRAEYVYSRSDKKPKSSDCLGDQRALVYKLADNWYFASVPDDWQGLCP